jgi:hypothetical protein
MKLYLLDVFFLISSQLVIGNAYAGATDAAETVQGIAKGSLRKPGLKGTHKRELKSMKGGKLQHVASGRCLDFGKDNPDGRLRSCGSTKTELKSSKSSKGFKRYRIEKGPQSGKFLDSEHGVEARSEDNTYSQKWSKVKSRDKDVFYLGEAHGDEYLQGDANKDGADVFMHVDDDYDDWKYMKWKFYSTSRS